MTIKGQRTAIGGIPHFYRLLPSPFGDVGLVWCIRNGVVGISAIFLPGEERGETVQALHDVYPGARRTSHEEVDEMGIFMERYFRGEAVTFPLDSLDVSHLTAFQKKVLPELYRVPRGRVVSYEGLAGKVNAPRAARAVGTAMARNPFPLVFPCHRVVRTSGEPGSFGGGTGLKRKLLALEGVEFDERGRIDARYYW